MVEKPQEIDVRARQAECLECYMGELIGPILHNENHRELLKCYRPNAHAIRSSIAHAPDAEKYAGLLKAFDALEAEITKILGPYPTQTES